MTLTVASIVVLPMNNIGCRNCWIKWSVADEHRGHSDRDGSFLRVVDRDDHSFFDSRSQQEKKWVVRVERIGRGGPEGMFSDIRPPNPNPQKLAMNQKNSAKNFSL